MPTPPFTPTPLAGVPVAYRSPGTPPEQFGSRPARRLAPGPAGYTVEPVVEGEFMATLAQRIRAFLGSPQGKRLIAQGQAQLAKPENQRKLKGLLSRLQKRR
jgi:hypothetical protein